MGSASFVAGGLLKGFGEGVQDVAQVRGDKLRAEVEELKQKNYARFSAKLRQEEIDTQNKYEEGRIKEAREYNKQLLDEERKLAEKAAKDKRTIEIEDRDAKAQTDLEVARIKARGEAAKGGKTPKFDKDANNAARADIERALVAKYASVIPADQRKSIDVTGETKPLTFDDVLMKLDPESQKRMNDEYQSLMGTTSYLIQEGGTPPSVAVAKVLSDYEKRSTPEQKSPEPWDKITPDEKGFSYLKQWTDSAIAEKGEGTAAIPILENAERRYGKDFILRYEKWKNKEQGQKPEERSLPAPPEILDRKPVGRSGQTGEPWYNTPNQGPGGPIQADQGLLSNPLLYPKKYTR